MTCAFQPLVDLETRAVIAHEALMRGPAGTPYASPMALLEAAQDERELAALDSTVHAQALQALADHPDGRRQSLFLNIEPRGIGHLMADALAQRWARARESALAAELDVVIELTERALLEDPAVVLDSVDQMRALGARIALDDVGATPESLAFLPIVQPDVVKLDLRFIRQHGEQEIAEISNAVRAYAEETGADVVAEGVETEADHAVAVSLGATVGQGWLYGRPGPLPSALLHARPVRRVAPPTVAVAPTPYAVVAAARATQVGSKAVLLPISHSLEHASRSLSIPPILLGCFQRARYFTPGTVRRYTTLAKQLPLVAALATDMPTEPADNVRGAALERGDALEGEWNVIVVGAHYAAALVALDLGDRGGAEHDRRFAYAVTHDRPLVLAAARTLVGRLTASRSNPV